MSPTPIPPGRDRPAAAATAALRRGRGHPGRAVARPRIDTLGHDPRSWYVERFWLSVLGPTSIANEPEAKSQVSGLVQPLDRKRVAHKGHRALASVVSSGGEA